jgi:tetratricopeptide (TPR) repeat protein
MAGAPILTHALTRGATCESAQENATAYHNRGSLFERLGKPKEALPDFTRAIALDPASALSYNARGLLWERMGKLDRAAADYDAALQLEPHTVVFLKNRGLCHRNRGK